MPPSPAAEPGEPATRERILAAARELFAARGYRGATLRAVAEASGVDVALIPYYFGSKDGLFTASVALPVRPDEIVDEVFGAGLDGIGARLVAALLRNADDPATGAPLIAVARSALTDTGDTNAALDYLRYGLISRYASHLPGPDATRRASYAATQMVGLLLARYVLRLPAIVDAPTSEVVATVGPVVQRYLTGELPPRGPGVGADPEATEPAP